MLELAPVWSVMLDVPITKNFNSGKSSVNTHEGKIIEKSACVCCPTWKVDENMK